MQARNPKHDRAVDCANTAFEPREDVIVDPVAEAEALGVILLVARSAPGSISRSTESRPFHAIRRPSAGARQEGLASSNPAPRPQKFHASKRIAPSSVISA
jgi:hypothetical protein